MRRCMAVDDVREGVREGAAARRGAEGRLAGAWRPARWSRSRGRRARARRPCSRSWAASSPPPGPGDGGGQAWTWAARRRLRDVRRRSIGFVFQQYNLFPALTALENVEYALNVKGPWDGRPRTRGRRGRWSAWAWPTGCISCPATSRADRSSGWPSRGRWRARRRVHPGRRAHGEPGHRGGDADPRALPRPGEERAEGPGDRDPRPEGAGGGRPGGGHPRRAAGGVRARRHVTKGRGRP